MSLGQNAVIVDPGRFSGTRQELAERLAPVLRVPAGQVISMLARGRVTVDADLDERTAKRLAKRLRGLGLPAQIVDEDGALAFEGVEEESGSAPAPSTDVDDELDGLLSALDGLDMVEFDDEADIPEIASGYQAKEERGAVEPARAAPEAEGDTSGLDAWGEVLPGLGSAPAETSQGSSSRASSKSGNVAENKAGSGVARPKLPAPSQGQKRAEDRAAPAGPLGGEPAAGSGVDERSASLVAQFEETAKQMEARKRREASPPPPQLPSSGPRNASGSPKPTAPTPRAEAPTRKGSRPAKASNAPNAQIPSTGPKSQPNGGVSPQERREIEASRAFDASALSAALVPRSNENRPPYEPTGFDPDPPHMAGAAAVFSMIAPGAGQVFNGDDEDALDYGLKFFLIKPWIDSVRNARRRGEKIAEYWLPRPEEGATLRAIRYVVLWWMAVAAVVTMLVALGNWSWEFINREPVVETTEAEIAAATEDAVTNVRLARIEALRALSEAQLSVPQKRFTMSDEERADRLFIIGYRHCEERNYSPCESIMRRVASLNKGDPRAFRLQAWASAARSGDIGEFPALEGIPTLTDFETEELSVELGVPSPSRIRDEKESKLQAARRKEREMKEEQATKRPDAGTLELEVEP